MIYTILTERVSRYSSSSFVPILYLIKEKNRALLQSEEDNIAVELKQEEKRVT